MLKKIVLAKKQKYCKILEQHTINRQNVTKGKKKKNLHKKYY